MEILRRVVSLIKCLSERGLPLSGETKIDGDANNGIFLVCLDLLDQFDPFLREHIDRHGYSGKGNISYMSSDICDEFITIMGKKVKE